jgi:hypothetical protein
MGEAVAWGRRPLGDSCPRSLWWARIRPGGIYDGDEGGRVWRVWAGFVDMSGNKRKEKAISETTRLEWRLRWAVVRDGMLYLSKDREVGKFLFQLY